MCKHKTYIFLLVTLNLFQYLSFSQTPKIDSLKSAYKIAVDTNKVVILNKLAWELMMRNPDTALTLSTQALQLAEKQNWQEATICRQARNHFRVIITE